MNFQVRAHAVSNDEYTGQLDFSVCGETTTVPIIKRDGTITCEIDDGQTARYTKRWN